MPIDPTTQVNASVVMQKDFYERLKAIAQKNKRSISKQILYWLEEQVELEERATQKKGQK